MLVHHKPVPRSARESVHTATLNPPPRRPDSGPVRVLAVFPRFLAFAFVLGLTMAGCGGDQEDGGNARQRTGGRAPAPQASETEGAPLTREVRQEAEEIFVSRCTVCHGQLGKGDGPGAAGLPTQPASFQDSTWQASVTDAHIERIIKVGGAAVGKSPSMPGNPDLKNRSTVVAGLRDIIRDFGESSQ